MLLLILLPIPLATGMVVCAALFPLRIFRIEPLKKLLRTIVQDVLRAHGRGAECRTLPASEQRMGWRVIRLYHGFAKLCMSDMSESRGGRGCGMPCKKEDRKNCTYSSLVLVQYQPENSSEVLLAILEPLTATSLVTLCRGPIVSGPTLRWPGYALSWRRLKRPTRQAKRSCRRFLFFPQVLNFSRGSYTGFQGLGCCHECDVLRGTWPGELSSSLWKKGCCGCI